LGPPLGGISNAFVTKLNPNGRVAYSRYLGSDDFDVAFGIALAQGCASNCNAYVVGRTNAGDFPTTAGVFQPTHPAAISGWVTQLSADGSTLVYSTYLGGPPNAGLGFSSQYVYAVAIDGAGDAYVTGGTIATGPVTESAAQDTIGGGFDCFVTKLNSTATQLMYSTFLGGGGNEGCLSIALVPSCSSNCNAYVTGFTSSTDLATTPGAAQPSAGGIRDGLVAELNAGGTEFLYTS
jgi:hypothetical protein